MKLSELILQELSKKDSWPFIDDRAQVVGVKEELLQNPVAEQILEKLEEGKYLDGESMQSRYLEVLVEQLLSLFLNIAGDPEVESAEAK